MKFQVLLISAALSTVAGFSSVGSANLAKWKKNVELKPVEAGGWAKLTELAEDPKGKLLDLLKESIETDGDKVQGRFVDKAGELNALISLLEAQGKGFDSNLIDGEWQLFLSLNSGKSPKLQKLVGMSEKFKSSYSNFDVKNSSFHNVAKSKRKNIEASLDYNPVAEGFSVVDGKIVVRRIACTITGTKFKIWKLPTFSSKKGKFKYGFLPSVSLPKALKGPTGWLEFVYLDEDIRITKGNRGGLFIHVRSGVL